MRRAIVIETAEERRYYSDVTIELNEDGTYSVTPNAPWEVLG